MHSQVENRKRLMMRLGFLVMRALMWSRRAVSLSGFLEFSGLFVSSLVS